MKKRTIFSLLAIVLIVILTSSTIALAAGTFTKDVGTSVTVLTPTPDLEVYSDPEATIPVTSINYGSLYPGDTSDNLTVYVKNTGQLNFTDVNVSDDIVVGLGVVTYSINDFPLARDAIQRVDLRLTIDEGAIPSSHPGLTTTFEGTY